MVVLKYTFESLELYSRCEQYEVIFNSNLIQDLAGECNLFKIAESLNSNTVFLNEHFSPSSSLIFLC